MEFYALPPFRSPMKVPDRSKHAGPLLLMLCLLLGLALGACDSAAPKIKRPARLSYFEGQALMDQELYSEALTKFQEVADQNPGTLLGSFAYLQIAEIHARQEKWVESETNYRLFLNANQSSHLTPFVLYRLVRVNYEASFTGVFFPHRETDRDMQPNRQIIQEYKRFYFLYPKSVFLDEVQKYAIAARETLADHERLVGDFYYRRGHYQAAAGRYLHLLRNYPQYPETADVLESLINAYRQSQELDHAKEMEQLYTEYFGTRDTPSDEFEGDAS